AHALRFSDNVFVLARTVFLHGKERYRRLWSRRDFGMRKIGFFAARPAFELGGEKTDGARHDFCALHLKSGWTGEAEVSWL
ncbi:hypothetical protein LCGC14_1967430, partial [marine sediment metagenome]